MNAASPEKFIAWNGEVRPRDEGVPLDPAADGLLYGMGCFETMALEAGKIRFAADHRARLEGALRELRLEAPADWDLCAETVERVARANLCPDGVGRLSFHAERGGVSWLVRSFPAGRFAAGGPLRVACSPWPHPGPSPLSRWKHNNYALNMLAFREATAAGFEEALLFRGGEESGSERRAVEGSLSTLWMLCGGELLTPPLSDGALGGVVRKRLLRAGSAGGVAVKEESLPESALRRADGLLLSNAAMLLRPVGWLDGRPVPVPGGLAASLNEAVRNADRPR